MKRKRYILIFYGILAALLLCESFLWIVGAIYSHYRTNGNPVRHEHNKNVTSILCLGDSFTYGVGAEKGYSYPEQLEKMLNNKTPDHKYVVINEGIPGCNSGRLLKHMQENIDKYNPGIILLLIGANDNVNFYESNCYLFFKGTKGVVNRVVSILSGMKTYKLISNSVLSMRGNRSHDEKAAFTSPNKNVSIESIRNNVSDKYIDEAKNYFNEKKVTLSKEMAEKALKVAPDDARAYYILGSIYLHCLHDNPKAIDNFEKAYHICPDNICLLVLFEAYNRNGDVAKSKMALEKYLEMVPAEKDKLGWMLKYSLPVKNDNEVFEKMTYSNIGEIIRIAKKNKIEIIILGYPHDNEIRKKAAFLDGVKYVDNDKYFSILKTKNGYSEHDYFAEDAHCNNKGYGVMAENVYSILKATGS